MKRDIQILTGQVLAADCRKTIAQATPRELYNAVSKAALDLAADAWKRAPGKRVAYLSAEFLVGRLVYANLLNMGRLGEVQQMLLDAGVDANVFEEIEDAALGNGGLGRLAACFLDSAATQGVPLDGYGIRYQYGLFRQYFEDGFQKETADDWQRFGDPWSVRREEDAVTVQFGGQAVRAVPYDTPVIGYGMKTVNTLRLWQAEPFQAFDFNLFNAQKYAAAVRERDAAEDISRVLYPNDDTDAGKRLRLKQQYFFSSASLQDMVRAYRAAHGGDFTHFADAYAVQLNDTHPTVAIPELLRLLVEEAGMRFADAVQVAHDTFAYTNHTIMPEALEKWDQKLFRGVLPRVYPYVKKLDALLRRTLEQRGVPMGEVSRYAILEDGMVHMARMAIFATHSTNGVARLHTEILKDTALHEWYELYPERFNNKTNGVTQRRWLALANPELAALLHDAVGDGWLTDLSQLKRLEPCADDPAFLARFMDVKREKKRQLAAYVEKHEGVRLHADFLLDVQVKRLHEYKRQLLNAFSILDTYYGLKEGRISRADFAPTVYLFGAKAAPGYVRAKGIIKYINELAELVNGDADVNGLMQVVFVQNYNVSYAEKIIPAADVSEQISTAGTEASGTSNMKFMLNGAVTLGTLDGANIEIAEQAGAENEYIFGARVDEIARLQEAGYDPNAVHAAEPRTKRVVDTLVDGTVTDGGTGMFRELYALSLRRRKLASARSLLPAAGFYRVLRRAPGCQPGLSRRAGFRGKVCAQCGKRGRVFVRPYDSGICAGHLARVNAWDKSKTAWSKSSMPFFYAFSIRGERGAADAKALRRTALVVTAFFQYHSDDLPLDEGQRLGEVERGGGGGRRIRVGGRKGKLRLQGGLNVRQPDLCIRAQFRQPFHHAVELQIVLRPRILAQQRKRIRVDAAPLPAGVYRMAVQIQAERGFHLRGLGVQGGKAEGKARQAVDEFHCRSADAPVTGFHTRKNQLVVLRGLSLQQKGQKLAPLRIVQRVQVLEIQRVFRIAKRRAVVSQQIIPGFTAQ